MHTIDKTLFLGGQASHEYITVFPGIYEYTVRINGKDCVYFKLDSDKNSKPPDPFIKPIDEITCQFNWTTSSQPTTYHFINNISSKNKGEKAGFYLKEVARIKEARFTHFVALAERIKNLEVTINYPNEECKVGINGFGKFEQETEAVKKEHDSNTGHEFHHMFAGEYGPESGLYVTIDCSEGNTS